MKARCRLAGSIVLAAVVLAPAARPDTIPPLPPLPQPIQGLLSPSPAADSKAQSSSDPRPSLAAVPVFGQSIVSAINRTRAQYGLRSLRPSAALQSAALAHAGVLAMTGQFTHSWSDGRAFPTWIRGFYSARGYRTWSVGENLLWSTPGIDAQTVVARWLASPTHRHILLTPSWREIGLGVVAATAAPGTYGGQDVDVVAAEFGRRSK